jgi:hypothetical protein
LVAIFLFLAALFWSCNHSFLVPNRSNLF